MNQTEARAAWVAALRSGEYKQGKGTLRDGDRYCCLGVACDLYRKHGGGPDWGNPKFGRYEYYLGYEASLPSKVLDWLGLSCHVGSYRSNSLVELNDNGQNFEEIANLIESEPEGLFIKGDK